MHPERRGWRRVAISGTSVGRRGNRSGAREGKRDAVPRQGGGRLLSACFARSLPKSAASDRQDAVRFLLGRAGVHMAFPRATIIHCRRSAVDTALSIHQTHFHPSLGFPTGGAELIAYFRSYQRLVDHWRRVLPPDRLIEVDYEDLTRAPDPAIRRLIDLRPQVA